MIYILISVIQVLDKFKCTFTESQYKNIFYNCYLSKAYFFQSINRVSCHQLNIVFYSSMPSQKISINNNYPTQPRSQHYLAMGHSQFYKRSFIASKQSFSYNHNPSTQSFLKKYWIYFIDILKPKSTNKTYNVFSMTFLQNILRNQTLFHKVTRTGLTLLITNEYSNPHHSIFNLRSAPTVTIEDYLSRMFQYLGSSSTVFIYSQILLRRALDYNPIFTINKQNIHRLLLVSNVLSTKYLDDYYYKNSYYANVGGVPLKLLNQMEIEFMRLLKFNCYVDQDVIDAYVQKILDVIDIQEWQQEHKLANPCLREKENNVDLRDITAFQKPSTKTCSEKQENTNTLSSMFE